MADEPKCGNTTTRDGHTVVCRLEKDHTGNHVGKAGDYWYSWR